MTAWAERKRFERMMQRRIVFYLFLTMLSLSIVLPSFARKKQKKTKAVAVENNSTPLSYNDKRRFDYFFLEAVRQQNQGKFAAAFDLYRHCQEIDTNASVPYYQLARYQLTLGHDTLATELVEKALQKDAANPVYVEFLANQYIRQNRIREAANQYERLYQTGSNKSETIEMLIRIYQHLQDYPLLLDALNRQELIDGADEDIALNKIYVYEQMNQPQKALNVLQHLSKAHPYDMKYKVMTANWLMQKNRKKEAFTLLTQVLKTEPENLDALASLYDYYRAEGNQQRTDELMRQLLFHPSTDNDQRVQLLMIAYRQYEVEGNDTTRMLSLLNRVLAADTTNVAVAELKESYLEMKGMSADSIDAINRHILSVAPDNIPARYRLLLSLSKKEEHEAVMRTAQAGIDYHPTEPLFYYFKGITAFISKDTLLAQQTLETAVEKCADADNKEIMGEFYQLLGDIYHEQGHIQKAFAAYDECLQLTPDNVGALNNYAYFLSIEREDLEKAERMSRRTIEKEPNNATYLDTYAWIRFVQGEYEDARKYIDLTLERGYIPSTDTDSIAGNDTISEQQRISSDVLEHAGDIYYHVGNAEKALEYWQKAYDMGSENPLLPEKIRLKKYVESDTKK